MFLRTMISKCFRRLLREDSKNLVDGHVRSEDGFVPGDCAGADRPLRKGSTPFLTAPANRFTGRRVVTDEGVRVTVCKHPWHGRS